MSSDRIPSAKSNEPWYRRCVRWGQTNLVEIDPGRYDDAFWRTQWRATEIDGVIVNAGGIVAYYPSAFELHNRAHGINEEVDLFGAVVRSAREDGLAVIARMDSNRVAEDFAQAHAEWIAVDASGDPHTVADKWVTCINSGYYSEYLPAVMREIIERSAPDGFADNSWAGLPRTQICHCRSCTSGFRAATGEALPVTVDWEDSTYRRWVRWNYDRRVWLWQHNNSVTRAAGGPDCLWIGMLSGNQLHNAERFTDLRLILRDMPFAMMDHQFRAPADGFAQNAEAGKRLHELVGWETRMPESMPMYALGLPAFRLTAMPSAEARLWAAHAFAGGIQPWWHHIGSVHDDRRQYETAPPIFSWHHRNQDVLLDRVPVADVAVVWSPWNSDFVGRDAMEERTLSPYRGWVTALVEAGIPYVPVHVDDMPVTTDRFRVLVLPEMVAMSEEQCLAVEQFAAAGGSVIASGETSLCTEWGEPRPDYALGKLLGVTRRDGHEGDWLGSDHDHEVASRHTYLRLHPSTADGQSQERHPSLAGFDLTDLVGFGGYLPCAEVLDGFSVPLTFVPRFPIYPPETAWMRQPDSGLPALVVGESKSGARSAMLLADVDRCADRERQPDHVEMLANLVRWAIGDAPSVAVETDGGVSVDVYAQDDRTIVHLANTVATFAMPARQHKVVPVGPVTVSLPTPPGSVARAELRVAGTPVETRAAGSRTEIRVARIEAHEVLVVEWS
jgi:hypothetical protein